VDTSKIHIAAVQQVKRPGFQQQFVQQADVVDLPAGHINIGRNAAPQVQQCVQLHHTLAAAKLAPGKKRQTQPRVVNMLDEKVVSSRPRPSGAGHETVGR
jgi:hypothetical protein